MKTLLFFFMAAAISLFAACNKNDITGGWIVLEDSILNFTGYQTYLADINRDGYDDVQFNFNRISSAGGWSEGWIDVVMLNNDILVNTVSVKDTFCLDSTAVDTWFIYSYSNCSSEEFYDTKDFSYAPLFSKTDLEAITFNANATDTVHILYFNYAHPSASYPGAVDRSIHEGITMDEAPQYFLFEDGDGRHYGLGIRSETYYTIFTDMGEV